MQKSKIVSAAKMVKGDTFQGTFKGVIELPFGPGYELLTEDNESVIVTGSKRLDYAFEKITPGTDVQLSYQGKSKSLIKTGKFAGKEVEGHSFNLDVVK